MRVLLDENLPHGLIRELPGHEVLTVRGLGWSGVANGELLRRARGRIDAFVTMDRNVERQQELGSLPFAIVIVHAHSNRMLHLRPLIGSLLEALVDPKPGTIRYAGGSTRR